MRTTANQLGRDAAKAPRRRARWALAVVATLMTLRVAWLALATADGSAGQAGPSRERSPRGPVATDLPAAAPQAAAMVTDAGRLTADEFAMLASVCPTSIRNLPDQLLPPHRLTAARAGDGAASARITGVRVAGRSPGSFEQLRFARAARDERRDDAGWLVSPEVWFVEEDRVRASVEPSVPSGPAFSPPVAAESSRGSTAVDPLPAPAASAIAADPPPVTGFMAPSRESPPSSSAPRAAAPPYPRAGAPAITPQPVRLEILPEPTGSRSGAPPASRPAASPTPAANRAVAPAGVLPTPPAPAAPTNRARSSAELVTPIPATPPAPRRAGPHPAGAGAEARAAAGGKSADESHAELFARTKFPSAEQCAECHQRIYDEWSVSGHAYAFVSPMFHAFEQKITELSQGTVGYFCQRCHSPVATSLGYSRTTSISDMPKVAREGVTCVACHRVNQRYNKTNGERRIEPGDIYDPVNGGVGGDGVAAAIARKGELKVKTSEAEKGPGQAMHREGRFFDQLTRAEACTSCHQVAVHPGIKLEVVWEQYRASPACKKGVSCQDCHMGRVPGVASGYNVGPIAEVAGKTVNNQRKQSSHLFYGPGYSLAHPGVFPQHKKADRWTVDEWLTFDWRAGWGTDDFEDRVEEAEEGGADTAAWFPPVWREVDDRFDAREVIDDNLKRLARKRRYRELVMENGSKVDGPFFEARPSVGRDLEFAYVVANTNEGHNLPTASLGAQPQLWANVALIDPRGRRIWESGYTDSNGDLCDIHSVDVRNGRAPYDWQLFNMQTMFLITGITGTDREFPLPVNLSFDPVAHLRPGTTAYTVANHPPFIRMESRSLAPLGKKRVKYRVPAELMRTPGRYRLSFRMRSRVEPPYFMRFCEATQEMQRALIEGTLDIHPQSVEFEVR